MEHKFTSNFDQYLICPSGDIVVGCARHGMGFEVNLYQMERIRRLLPLKGQGRPIPSIRLQMEQADGVDGLACDPV